MNGNKSTTNRRKNHPCGVERRGSGRFDEFVNNNVPHPSAPTAIYIYMKHERNTLGTRSKAFPFVLRKASEQNPVRRHSGRGDLKRSMFKFLIHIGYTSRWSASTVSAKVDARRQSGNKG